MAYVLRDYQLKGVADIRQCYVNGIRAVLYVLPTGGGKTVVFCFVASSTGSKPLDAKNPSLGNKRVLILVHRIELLRQTAAKLYENGVEHGIINPKFTPNPMANIQVASVQTLASRIKKGTARVDYDLVIVDEAHHAVAKTWITIMAALPKKCRVLGVTATPIRSDGSGLADVFDAMILGPTMKYLIGIGSLVPAKVYAPTEKLDLSGVKIKNGDYDPDDLESIIDNSIITGDAIATYRQRCAHQPAIYFCVSVAHAEHVAEEFRKAGFKAQSIDGSMEDAQRKALINGLGTGRVEILVSCDIISEGTDIPNVMCAGMLRPTKSMGLYLQQAGRALRPAPGKPFAVILDHVGNCLLHGMPDEDREWSLEGDAKQKSKKKKDEPEIRVKQCPTCFAMHSPAPKCPECGHQYVTEAREVEQKSGELRELTDEDKEAISKLRNKEIAKAESYEALVAIGQKYNYKPGWAKHKWEARQAARAKYGHSPRPGGPPPITEVPDYVR